MNEMKDKALHVSEMPVAGILVVQRGSSSESYYLMRATPVNTWNYDGVIGLVFSVVPKNSSVASKDGIVYFPHVRWLVVSANSNWTVEYYSEKESILVSDNED